MCFNERAGSGLIFLICRFKAMKVYELGLPKLPEPSTLIKFFQSHAHAIRGSYQYTSRDVENFLSSKIPLYSLVKIQSSVIINPNVKKTSIIVTI